MMTHTTFAPPQCNASSTGRAATDWGESALPCQTTRGLRSLVDRRGVTRYFCSAPNHERKVVRQFGRQSSEACRFCGDTAAIVDGRYVLIAFEDGLRVVCDNCVEKADEEPDDPEDEYDRNPEGDPTLNGAFR